MKIIFTLLVLTLRFSTIAQQVPLCFLDSDLDGYGDPNKSTPTSTFGGCPLFYVSNSLDCDDNNNTIGPKVWYRDRDQDGFGDGTSESSSCTRPDGYSASLLSDVRDCDDFDANIYPVKWYIDKDRDGYAFSMDSSIFSCTVPGGDYGVSEVDLKGVDCDDQRPEVFPRIYYLDMDHDGYRAYSGQIEETFLH
jgi:hypothetical protein